MIGAARRRRVAELALLFTAGPALLALGPRWLVTVGILASGVACAVVLWRDSEFPRRELTDFASARPGLGRVLRRTLVIWLGLLAATALAAPDMLFAFPRT